MPTLTYRISILGCRVNHAEARDLESILIARGLTEAPDGTTADVEVVHTCSVTNTAAAKSRQASRRAQRRQNALEQSARDGVAGVGQHLAAHQSFQGPSASPSRLTFVTGCYASTNLDEASAIFGTAHVIPQDAGDGRSLAERFENRLDEWLTDHGMPHRTTIRPATRCSSESCETTGDGVLPLPVVRAAADAGSHIRAEIRIQDGCDAHCTFCIIPKIRPTLRSKRIRDVVREARMLVEHGHREIVLSGIFIGAYGHETALRRNQQRKLRQPLADLLDEVAQVPGLERVRISSMEPGDMTVELLDAMVANRPVVVPHLHLPLQSGSNRILRRMNRQYTVEDYLEMIDMVNNRLSLNAGDVGDPLPPAITTDIICGFPGETDRDFDETLRVARQVGYLHMHVFPFSAKKGTAAARWQHHFVADDIRKQRVRRLIDLETNPGNGTAIEFMRQLVGRTVRVMIEQPDPKRSGHMIGRCDHYAMVSLPVRAARGTLVEARITSAAIDSIVGRPVSTRVALPVVA